FTPALGRVFTPEECTPGGPKAAMLTYGFWRSRFGGDPGVIGRSLTLDGTAWRITGVLPPNFEQPNLARPAMVLGWQLNLAPGVQRSFLTVFARLRPGITPDQARESILPLVAEMRKSIPAGFAREVTF